MTLICPTWVPYCEVIQIEKKRVPGASANLGIKVWQGCLVFLKQGTSMKLTNVASCYWELS